MQRGSLAAIVDPGDHVPVLAALKRLGLDLAAILLTHHHADHIGGVAELKRRYDPLVFGPDDARIPEYAVRVGEGDRARLDNMGLSFDVLEVPAHTRSHIAFFGHGMLFSGDTLFSIGCGKLFEGTPGQMQAAMDKLAALPATTKVYCGHEYTASNCVFALKVEPQNDALKKRYSEVRELRSRGKASLPSTIGDEIAANPFMRTRCESVVRAAQKRSPGVQAGAETLGVIRHWKDQG
ncbi:MAG: hydroxyacylglutathione hydrolase, partial [Xanthomonadales bacterium]|nr:hydroxyacylglutathione hydrolase [Xanthomonadales bacterium]